MANLFSILIILISLFWWPWAAIPFEVPKVTMFTWFVKLLTVIFVFSFLTKKHNWTIDTKKTFLVVILLVWALITAFFGVDPIKSVLGNYYRSDGLLTFFHLVGFSFLVSYYWRESSKKKISFAFFISSTILSVISIIEISTNKFGLGEAATFGNPNFLAGYLAICTPFIFYLFRETGQRMYLLGLLIVSTAIILIGATAPILTLILFLILLTAFYVNRRYKKLLIVSLFIAFILIVLLWVRGYYFANSKSYVAEGRVRIFRNVLTGFIKKPIMGYGWANVDYAFESANWPMKFNNDVYVDKAHSEFLEILVTTGIPGIILYGIFVCLLFKKVLYTKDNLWRFTLLSTLILYLFHAQTNVISIAEQMIFWLIVGICLVGV